MRNHNHHTVIGILFLLMVIPFLGIQKVHSQTSVSGAIITNTTWDLAGSPYQVTGNVTVFGGATLTIEPGVYIDFVSATTIEVQGEIYAEGEDTAKITFKGTGLNNGRIHVNQGYGRFDHCIFDNMPTGIDFDGGGIPSTDSIGTVTNCRFFETVSVWTGGPDNDGIEYYGSGSYSPGIGPLRIENCVFDNLKNGIRGSGNIDVVQCIFKNNDLGTNLGGPYGIFNSTFCNNTQGIGGSSGEFRIVNNRFFNNTNTAVQIANGDPNAILVKDNVFQENYIGLAVRVNIYGSNTFCDNSHANIATLSGIGTTVQFPNQCFCSSDSAAIAPTILDAFRDGSRPFSNWSPFIACDSTAAVPVDCDSLPPCDSISASFTASIPVGPEVDFVSTSSGDPARYIWDFGDGSGPIRGSDSVHYTYSDTGLFNVRLIISNGCFYDTAYQDVHVTCLPLNTDWIVNFTTGFSVSFGNTSSGYPASWLWNFGDGDSSNATGAFHTYPVEGTYLVCLTGTNACSFDSMCQPVVVSCPPPTPSFTYSNTGTNFTFDATSGGLTPITYEWDFGDGSSSFVEDPTHDFGTTGTFTVCLIATNSCGVDTTCQTISTSGGCPTPTTSYTFARSGLTLDFFDGSSDSPTSWHWDFGDGTTSSIQNPVHTFASSGTYLVCLTATNACGSDTLCYLIAVSASCPFPSSAFTFSGLGTTVNFNDISTNSPTSWDWSFGDGTTSTLQNPSHTFPATGLYSVCLIATNACGSDTICQTVNVGGGGCLSPDAAFTFTGAGTTIIYNDISTNSPVSWSWDFGDGGTDTIQNPSHSYSSPGTYTVCLVATNGCGVDTTCQTVVVTCIAPTAAYSYSASTTELTFSSISSGGPTAWFWTFGDGDASLVENPVHTYASTGSYTVCLIASNACASDTFCQNITVICPLPGAAFTYSTSGTTVDFNNLSTDGVSWDWDFGVGSSTDEHPVFTFPSAGSYSVCLIAENSCGTDTNCQSVNVTCPIPTTVSASGPLEICDGDTVTLSAPTSTSYSYQWLIGGAPIPGKTNSTLDVNVDGIFQVEISNGTCSATSLPVEVKVNPLPAAVITALGPTSFCPGSSVELEAPSGFLAYSWNTGAITQNIFATESGDYVVSVVDTNGCVGPSPVFNLNITGLADPEICIVSVDTATNRNMIVWEKPLTAAIDSFRIYKETTVSGDYELLGSQHYSEFSTFIDFTSNPRYYAARYKISILDTCGAESPLSDHHKTIHLTVNKGLGTQWNLIWEGYEGLIIPTIRIWRGIDQNHLFLVDSLAGTMTTWIDISPPPGDLVYALEMVYPSGCTPTAKTGYSSSFSNFAETKDAVSIDQGLEDNRISIFPNPTENWINLRVENATGAAFEFELTDLTGKVLIKGNDPYSSQVFDQKINLDGYAKGIYLLKTTLGKRNGLYKVIKR